MVDKCHDTFIFYHQDMTSGGIQINLRKIVTSLINEKYRIIWIFPVDGHIDEDFEDVFNSNNLEIVRCNVHKKNWYKTLGLSFSIGERVFMFSSSIVSFCRMEQICRYYNNISMDNFYWVPHFKGEHNFLEEFISNRFLRKLFWAFFRKIHMKLDKNNNIFYLSYKHLHAYENHYKYTVVNPDYKVYTASNNSNYIFNKSDLKNKSKRKPFNILTITRFSFPHKAYLIGLIHSYKKLKTKYPQITLTIGGYGEGESIVKEEICKLSGNIQRDVKMVGRIPFNELYSYFRKASVFVGVAGAAMESAYAGVITIPVRLYSETCEGYGFLPRSKDCFLCEKPGIAIEEYIEQLIAMSSDEYEQLSQETYDAFFNKTKETATNELLSKVNIDKNKRLPLIYLYISLLYFFLGHVILCYKYRNEKSK